MTANQTVTEGPEVTAGAPMHGPVRPPMQPGQLGWCKHALCNNPLYGDEWPHTVCDLCFGPNSEECAAGFGACHEDTDEEPADLASGDSTDSDEDDTDSEDDDTAPDGEPQWPPLGAAFGINICQPCADTAHSPTVTHAAAPGAQEETEAPQHTESVASMPIHTMDAAPAPCTDPDPTVSVTAKGHNETNAPAISGSERALEEALLRDAASAQAAASYHEWGDLPYQRVGGAVHQRLDGPWSKRVLQDRRARHTEEVIAQAARPADYQQPEALNFHTGRGMLVELGLRPRSPSPEALPDETIELPGEVHLDTLPGEAEEGMITPPCQTIPQSAYTDEEWEREMLNPPPQWGTPHPTHGYLANEDRAQSPPIDLDIPSIDQSGWGPVPGFPTPDAGLDKPQPSQEDEGEGKHMGGVGTWEAHAMQGNIANMVTCPPTPTDAEWAALRPWEQQLHRDQCRRAKASRVRAMMDMARCDHGTAEAAYDNMKGLMHITTVEHEREYILSWAKYTILADAHLEALQPHCKDGKLPPEQDQPGPHDESPSLTCKQPTAAHWSTAALNTASAPEPTHPGPPASRHEASHAEATVEAVTAKPCDIADEEKANSIMSRCLPYGMEAAFAAGEPH